MLTMPYLRWVHLGVGFQFACLMTQYMHSITRLGVMPLFSPGMFIMLLAF